MVSTRIMSSLHFTLTRHTFSNLRSRILPCMLNQGTSLVEHTIILIGIPIAMLYGMRSVDLGSCAVFDKGRKFHN